MLRRIEIDPVTRVEGHGKISLIVDDQGKVSEALFCVQEFRGFEKFCEGSLAEKLPQITSRICGICPISHNLASIKAIEDCFGTKIPPTAERLRELMMLGQVIESHVLSILMLSVPDLMLRNAGAKERNLLGMYQSNADAVQRALELRGVGTAIANVIGRRAGHPVASRIGGMSVPLADNERQELLSQLNAAQPHLVWLSQLLRTLMEQNDDLIDSLGDIRSSYLGLMSGKSLAFYDGEFQLIQEDGSPSAAFKPSQYFDYIEERAEKWSYMKFPVLKAGGSFRVGSLARVNIAEKIPTPMASQELEWFRQRWPRPAHKTLCYHYARMIELIYAFERSIEILSDPHITDRDVFAKPTVKAGTGIGAVEAPRGTLIHRYELDGEGKAAKVDLFVATQHNNYGFNQALSETARKLPLNDHADNATLNKLEMIVRAYDPCLSCATHSIGEERAFTIEMIDQNGSLIKEWRR
jgi:coenzyme F420-reducing hydrogenase alpha subunit